MKLSQVVEQLKDGPVTFVAHGNSMHPKIKSGDTVTVEPINDSGLTVCKGEIVLAKVRGKYFLHLVSATEGKRVQISNSHGHVNGWAPRTAVLGRIVR